MLTSFSCNQRTISAETTTTHPCSSGEGNSYHNVIPSARAGREESTRCILDDVCCAQTSESVSSSDIHTTTLMTLQNHMSLLSETRRRIWVHGPRPEYTKDRQRFNLPSRITSLLRPNLDIIILPGNHAPTAEFWEFNREVLGLSEWQVLACFETERHEY